MLKKKKYKCFARNIILIEYLWILAMLPLLPALLCGLSGAFSFWEIFACCCITLVVIIATIITMVLTKYKIDSDGITIDVSRKCKQLVLWSEITSVEITRVKKYGEYTVELKNDNVTIIFNTFLKNLEAIKEFGKGCDNFHRLFSERLETAFQTGYAINPTNVEQIPDVQDTKIFISDKERQAFGGTGFYEIQYCEKDLPIKKLLYLKNISHWLSDSLYIEALTAADKFFNEYYDKIFSKFGGLDYCGINYFNKEQTQKILYELQNQDLPDKKTLIYWLEVCVSNYNGFYFLGV